VLFDDEVFDDVVDLFYLMVDFGGADMDVFGIQYGIRSIVNNHVVVFGQRYVIFVLSGFWKFVEIGCVIFAVVRIVLEVDRY